MGVEVLKAEVLAGTHHGFLGRRGGVSRGVVQGLNVGLGAIGPGGDDAASVAENRRRAGEAVLPGARLVTCHQVHSARCVVAGEWADNQRPEADALVTDQPGVLLGILTADCAPVLFADVAANDGAGVVGAAHAGWKGAFGGICEATVEAMLGLGAARERITAAVGPCIAQASYEVDGAFRANFLAQSAGNVQFFAEPRENHWQFDLSAYVCARLAGAGITRIAALNRDTYAEEARFYSFRRATHRAEPAYGRQISLIGLAR